MADAPDPEQPVSLVPISSNPLSPVRDRLDEGIADLRLTRKIYPMKYPFPPAEVVEFFRTYYGPSNRAFAALDPDKQALAKRSGAVVVGAQPGKRWRNRGRGRIS